jgi:hypothetical protein
MVILSVDAIAARDLSIHNFSKVHVADSFASS